MCIMGEIEKICNINSINDFFEFKISVKLIIFVAVIYFICCSIFVVFMLGGVNNTIKNITNILNSTKKAIIINKDNKEGETHQAKKNDDSNEE